VAAASSRLHPVAAWSDVNVDDDDGDDDDVGTIPTPCTVLTLKDDVWNAIAYCSCSDITVVKNNRKHDMIMVIVIIDMNE
jgi:hypothetical protein